MPIKIHTINGKYYYQYGTTGTKYYFNPKSERSMKRAYNKSVKQAAAIHITKKP
jgi:hypothetical protein